MASPPKKRHFCHSLSALHQFIALDPTEDEVNEVYDALEALLEDPNPGYRVPFSIVLTNPGHRLDSLYRIDVGRFAAHYETNGTVYVHEIFLPLKAEQEC